MIDGMWKVRETKGSKWIFLDFGIETRWAEIPFTEKGETGGGTGLERGSEDLKTFSLDMLGF